MNTKICVCVVVVIAQTCVKNSSQSVLGGWYWLVFLQYCDVTDLFNHVYVYYNCIICAAYRCHVPVFSLHTFDPDGSDVYIIVSWKDKVPNEGMRVRTGQESIENTHSERRLRWFCHLMRKDHQRIAQQALSWEVSDLKMGPGRVRTNWRRVVKKDLRLWRMRLTWEETEATALNRQEWGQSMAQCGLNQGVKVKRYKFKYCTIVDRRTSAKPNTHGRLSSSSSNCSRNSSVWLSTREQKCFGSRQGIHVNRVSNFRDWSTKRPGIAVKHNNNKKLSYR